MILPNGEIRLYTNIEFSDYSNIRLFENLDEQKKYFNEKAYSFYLETSYTKYDEGKIRIDDNAERLYTVNYIAFKNSAFGEKWFYGFVTEVEYISQRVTILHFEIDVFNTWFYDLNFQESFIERETTDSDLIGEHTLPEGLELGAYTTSAEKNILSDDLSVYLMATQVKWEYKADWWENPVNIDLSNYFEIQPSVVGDFPISCYVAKFGTVKGLNLTALKVIVDTFAEYGKSDAIISIFTAPTSFVSTTADVREQRVTLASNFMESYAVRNNKLLTYPYSTLVVQAGGSTQEFRYELFKTIPEMKIIGGFGANLQVIGIPLNYENQEENLLYSMAIKDFPLLPYNKNYYENWLAQNKNSISLSNTIATVGGITGTVASLATGNVLGALGSIGTAGATITNNMMAQDKAKITPDSMNGTINGADILAVTGRTGFYSYCRHILPEYARSIDDYFSRYGYKVNVSKTPNLYSREYWNYVKISDPILIGNIPAKELREIKQIFKDGVTLWHTDMIGRYDLINNVKGVDTE